MPYKDYEKQKEFQRKWKLQRTEKLRLLKDAPCTDCKQKFPTVCMQWDHLGKQTKFKNLSRMTQYKFERCLEEIEKCELVCANCHAIRTYNRGL